MKGPFRIFKTRNGRKVILFPFAKTFVETDEIGIAELRSWDSGQKVIQGSPFLENLEKRGLIDEIGKPLANQAFNHPYLPTAVTLFPTLDCNLRCRYCYASGGDRKTQMPLEIGKTAINYIAANALATDSKRISLTFHGGGEPTYYWEFITAVTAYARTIAKVLDLSGSIHIGTNGVLDSAKIEWMIKNLDSATISIDGPQDIHDAQRPMADGTGSFLAVMNTVTRFQQSGFPFQIRTTVTSTLLSRLHEFIEEMGTCIPSVRMHQLEPMFPTGRGAKLNELAPPINEFSNAMRSIMLWARNSKYPVMMSSCNISSSREYYCGSYGENFVVTPDGNVTTCYEVSSPSDPHWRLFHIGEYLQSEGKFRVNSQRVDDLRRKGVADIAACGGCFARFSCGGDCPVKRIALREHHTAEKRCQTIKMLTLEEAQYKLETAKHMDGGSLTGK